MNDVYELNLKIMNSNNSHILKFASTFSDLTPFERKAATKIFLLLGCATQGMLESESEHFQYEFFTYLTDVLKVDNPLVIEASNMDRMECYSIIRSFSSDKKETLSSMIFGMLLGATYFNPKANAYKNICDETGLRFHWKES
jgi:hypothetical protein